MFYPESFSVTAPSDCELRISRKLDAPRPMVFQAFTKPELVQRWLLGPDGWTMPVCEIDFRVGGRYRYVWQKTAQGNAYPRERMGIGGEYREIEAGCRIVCTERFDEAWYPGEALNTTTFEAEGDTTVVAITVLYISKEARDTARASGMERGMAATFNRLEKMLPEMPG